MKKLTEIEHEMLQRLYNAHEKQHAIVVSKRERSVLKRLVDKGYAYETVSFPCPTHKGREALRHG